MNIAIKDKRSHVLKNVNYILYKFLERNMPNKVNVSYYILDNLNKSYYLKMMMLSLSKGTLKKPVWYKQGNSVARDLPRIGSETNTTIFVIYILDIDSHCPL